MVNSNIFKMYLKASQIKNKTTSGGPYSVVGFTRDFGGPDYSPVLFAICVMILVLAGYSIHVKLSIFQVRVSTITKGLNYCFELA